MVWADALDGDQMRPRAAATDQQLVDIRRTDFADDFLRQIPGLASGPQQRAGEAIAHQCGIDAEREQGPGKKQGSRRPIGFGGWRLGVDHTKTGDDPDRAGGGEAFRRRDELAGVEKVPPMLEASQAAAPRVAMNKLFESLVIGRRHGWKILGRAMCGSLSRREILLCYSAARPVSVLPVRFVGGVIADFAKAVICKRVG